MNDQAKAIRASYSFWIHEQGADHDSGYGHWDSTKVDSKLALTKAEALAVVDVWNKDRVGNKVWMLTEVEPVIKV